MNNGEETKVITAEEMFDDVEHLPEEEPSDIDAVVNYILNGGDDCEREKKISD